MKNIGFRNTEPLVTRTGYCRGMQGAKAQLEPSGGLGLLGETVKSRSEAGDIQSGTACCAKK